MYITSGIIACMTLLITFYHVSHNNTSVSLTFLAMMSHFMCMYKNNCLFPLSSVCGIMHGCIYSLGWTTGLDCWTGLLDSLLNDQSRDNYSLSIIFLAVNLA